jgi:serine/threonine protein kinase
MGNSVTPEPLQRLGDFEIVREIGRGGMGIVYEARQISLNRKVALKVLGAGLGLTEKAVQRFRREAEAAARLHHTNIVPIYATGEDKGIHYYAMELIEGPSLDHVIRQLRKGDSPLSSTPTVAPSSAESVPSPPTGPYVPAAPGTPSSGNSISAASGNDHFDRIARMVAEVADGLEYAQHQGVIHRDIKPSNLLLSPEGRLSINDFGLARLLEEPGMTMTGEFVGTPAYMSPEQITSGRVPLDHRTDIYSLGATLYELLTLQPPFTGERRDQVLAQILQKEPRPPRKVNKKVPVDLETICLKALDKDPDRRYQGAEAMADDLRRYVNRFAISARRAGPVERLRKWLRRHPGLAAGVVLALLALSLAGFFAVQSWRDRQERLAMAEKTRQEKLDEKQMQAVKEIFAGEFTAAEEAIRQAEALGAPTEWVQWRRGQIAFHQGRYADAIALLEPAVQSMPENLAANWLLVDANVFRGDTQRVAGILSRIRSLPAREVEECLYKGWYLCGIAPEECLTLLERAVVGRTSLLAFSIRASLLGRIAFERPNFKQMQEAMADITAAKRLMQTADCTVALEISVMVHHRAAILYQQGGKSADAEAALRIARADAEALARFPDRQRAAYIRGAFLADDGQQQEAVQWFEKCMTQKTVTETSIRFVYAWLLYERGEAGKAFQVVEEDQSRVDVLSSAVFVAELPDGLKRARQICARVPRPAHPFGVEDLARTLGLLGQKEEAIDALHSYQPGAAGEDAVADQFIKTLFDYFKNPNAATEQGLLKLASRNKGDLMEAHLCIGVRQLADGNRSLARDHFQACVDVHVPGDSSYLWGRAVLTRMKNDPTWPPWIPLKR